MWYELFVRLFNLTILCRYDWHLVLYMRVCTGLSLVSCQVLVLVCGLKQFLLWCVLYVSVFSCDMCICTPANGIVLSCWSFCVPWLLKMFCFVLFFFFGRNMCCPIVKWTNWWLLFKVIIFLCCGVQYNQHYLISPVQQQRYISTAPLIMPHAFCLETWTSATLLQTHGLV